MTNNHAILGIANNATEDEVKKAYRRLAMEHHPDRGGNEESFKKMKAAFEAIEASGFRPYTAPPPQPPPSRSSFSQRPGVPPGAHDVGDLDEILQAMRSSRSSGRPNFSYVQPEAEPVARVSLRDAFYGFTMPIQRRRGNGIEHLTITVPPGTPDGYRGKYQLNDGSFHYVTTRIDHPGFHVRGLIGQDNLFNAGLTVGDVEVQVELDAIDLITGCWTIVEDFLGEKLQVRVPAGFSPLQRLKVANKGYYGWDEQIQKSTRSRQHMFIKINPVFKRPQDIPREKVLALYNAVGGWEQDGNDDA